MSGVSTQFQNGVAENAIKMMVAWAHTMMLHAALWWLDVQEQSLWPYALLHAAYLHNQTPNQHSGFAPVKVWTKTKSDYTQLKNLHVWGSPTYVLDPTLRNGLKLPKWSPRSRWGQYMGQSTLHASTVGLILNLQTGNVLPQYHVVHDDYFETVYADGEEPPGEWAELVTLKSSNFACSWQRRALRTSTQWWMADSGRMSKSKTELRTTATEWTAWTEGAPGWARTTRWESATSSCTNEWTYGWSTPWRRAEGKDNKTWTSNQHAIMLHRKRSLLLLTNDWWVSYLWEFSRMAV